MIRQTFTAAILATTASVSTTILATVATMAVGAPAAIGLASSDIAARGFAEVVKQGVGVAAVAAASDACGRTMVEAG